MTLVGYSAAAADKQGNVYVVHRPEIRMWIPLSFSTRRETCSGRGARACTRFRTAFASIRRAMCGRWTPYIHGRQVHAEGKNSSKSASARSLTGPGICGATDVAFAQNGNVFVSDGYCNGRVIEYAADGRSCANSASAAPGPAN